MSASKRTFIGDFKRFFGRGLAILLPSILTLWILWQAFVFLFQNVAEPINRGIRIAVVRVVPAIVDDNSLPTWFAVTEQQTNQLAQTRAQQGLKPLSPEALTFEARRANLREFWNDHWYLSATGLLVAILLIYLAGWLLGGILGRRAYAKLENGISRIPGFKQVYPHVKQVVDLILGERPTAFKRVVAVEYPRKGIWTVGFVTSDSMKAIHERADQACVSIFIPSTPMPFTGFTINVPTAEVLDLPLSIDEAVRFFITGGVLIPDRQLPPGVEPADLTPSGDDES